jgi:putative membrane protein
MRICMCTWATLTFFLVFAMAVFAQQNQPQEYPKDQGQRTIEGPNPPNNPVKGIDDTDLNFLKHAAVGDQAEIELAQMAQQKSSDPAVKRFAARMIKDHSANDDKLVNIAASQHISLPNELPPKQKDAAERLSKLSSSQFDKAYMQLMVQEHTEDVGEFQKEASSAQDPTVQHYAEATLPVLQSHLNEAKQVDQHVSKP